MENIMELINRQNDRYWGHDPLPLNSELIGSIRNDNGRIGSLIKLEGGKYVIGNGGLMTNLNQDRVKELLKNSKI
jgi:hypothetical protein